MQIHLKSEDFQELVQVKSLNDTFEAEHHVAFPGMKGKMRKSNFDGIIVEQREVSLNKDLIIDVKQQAPVFKMQFELDGHSIYKANSSGLDVEIRKGHHNLFFLPEVNGLLKYPGPLNRKTLEIYLTLDFVEQLFGDQLEALRVLEKGIYCNQPVRMSNKSIPISMELHHVIRDILHCPFTGAMRKAYMKAKITELLILQLDSCTPCTNQNKVNVSSHDVEKYHYIKEVIEQNFQTPYSINELSKLAGMCATKLKTGFKELFRVSPSEYLVISRMNFAHLQLTSTNKSIAAISEEVGFKNPQHFTVAFKKRFGYLPSSVRKK
ncbi:helix-turn-helix transcriptional regulator [Flexithrix dorotheae]|uniref:helix-turn-helix transcriptional regulator n=1 Tax=Flexithrix dorotheae TaxID=70993 RepID=UPI00036C344E|nr:AraC family transcriptional regulator [Flexithrix dorotheae]